MNSCVMREYAVLQDFIDSLALAESSLPLNARKQPAIIVEVACEALGLDWAEQFESLQKRLKRTLFKISSYDPYDRGRIEPRWALLIEDVPYWLMFVDAAQVDAEMRQGVQSIQQWYFFHLR